MMPIEEKTILKTLIGQRAQILAYINFIVRDRDIAEDIYQDVSIYTLKNQTKINDEQHLARYIRKVARNHALNAIEKERRKPLAINHQLLELLEADWQSIEEQDTSPMHGALKTCLTHLTPYASKLIAKRYVDGVSGQDLADQMGKQLNTVYVALSRIHKSLSSCIKEKLSTQGYKI